MSGTYALSDCPALVEFLAKERAATVALPIKDGGVHVAALLYYHTAGPLRFYFVTGRDTEKCQLLAESGALSGACVVGTCFGTPFTLQMRGQFEVLDPARYQEIVGQYYDKRGNRKDDIDDPTNVLIGFTPVWARFTDYSKGYHQTYLKL